jgi:hypothetical protein
MFRGTINLGLAVAALAVSTNVMAVDKWLDYYPYNERAAAMIYGAVTGAPKQLYTMWVDGPRPEFGEQQVVEWRSPNGTAPSQYEIMETGKDCGYGVKVVWLKGYRDNVNVYGLRPLKVTYVDEDTGAEFDMTKCNGVDPTKPLGHVYGLDELRGGPYRLKVWGEIWGQGKPQLKFYWEELMQYLPAVTNPCWQGPNPTRPAWQQQEVWWSGNLSGQGNWSIGEGLSAPFDSLGRPVAAGTVRFDGSNVIGRSAGLLWTGTTKLTTGQTFESCMMFRWNW